MSKELRNLPLQFDPFRLAEVGQILEGTMPLVLMRRVNPLLVGNNTEIKVSLTFGIESTGVRFVNGRIIGRVILRCQRCLEEMDFDIDADFLLAFVKSEHEGHKLYGDHDLYIVKKTPIMLSDIIEDELILTIPNIPKHENRHCQADIMHQAMKQRNDHDIDANTDKQHPFAILKDLKHKDTKD